MSYSLKMCRLPLVILIFTQIILRYSENGSFGLSPEVWISEGYVSALMNSIRYVKMCV